MSNKFFESPAENWTIENIAAHYCFEDNAHIFDCIKKDIKSRSNMKDDVALLANQLLTSKWKLIIAFFDYEKFVEGVKTCLTVDTIRASLRISPVANLFNKNSFLLLYNMQREATISTYADGAKSMAKTNPRKCAKDQLDSEGIKKVTIQIPSTSATGNDESQDSIHDIDESMKRDVEIDSENVIVDAE
ncbi:10967_t:CDS:2 [Entrophospora sp. SA101]|nr:5633_t:CDS:2 [Entrophospora sp. SA101]CAJ0897012.1 10967_t:CDS:2 [Entrophospora sp. SA101]